jgi:mono/diheme cytochrome c family protein
MHHNHPPDSALHYVSGTLSEEVSWDDMQAGLARAGISHDQAEVLSTVPHESSESTMGLHRVTILAGLIGLGVGLFLSAGTALLYQINTGGKPIVSWPVVGIISYEVMMLFAIVSTFIAMALRIHRAARRFPSVGPLNEGRMQLVIQVDRRPGDTQAVIEALEHLGVRDIAIVSGRNGEESLLRRAAESTAVIVLGVVLTACPQNMSEQPSFQSQEAPRRHSPADSVPRTSRAVALPSPAPPEVLLVEGRHLFDINCAHCHGQTGSGDGPVAGYLKELPANLHRPDVREKSVEALYAIITDGYEAMPAFRGELSADDRWALAYYVNHLSERP